MILPKEATDKDRLLKIQLMLPSNNPDEKLSGQPVWKSVGYCSDTKPRPSAPSFTLKRQNFSKRGNFKVV